MNARAPDTMALFKLVLMALAFAAGAYLLRDGLAIGSLVPRDPNEGWNAYLAQAAISGAPLYPHGLMTNNYPPLSFYIVGALSRITGDAILAGRIVSLAAALAIAGGVTIVLREMRARALPSLFGGLFVLVALCAGSDYVAMNDPQLMGHALQLAGLTLLLQPRRESLTAAALMAAGLFIKHNLIALPLASSLWLLGQDRKEAMRFITAGLLLCVAGLVLAWLLLDVNLPAALDSPRVWRLANFTAAAKQFLSWSVVALALVTALMWRRRRDPLAKLALLYLAASLFLAGVFAFGDGVDSNVFFDLAIALGLGLALLLQAMPAKWAGPLALAACAPLALFIARHAHEDNFAFSEGFARLAPGDIAFLRGHDGPALCEDLTLCYWAGKDDPVDVFNLSEAIATGARSDGDLAHLLETRHFRVIAVTGLMPFALGPHLKKVLLANYRIHHEDDNGVFLEPISPTAPP